LVQQSLVKKKQIELLDKTGRVERMEEISQFANRRTINHRVGLSTQDMLEEGSQLIIALRE
jgi:hypothetical protein